MANSFNTFFLQVDNILEVATSHQAKKKSQCNVLNNRGRLVALANQLNHPAFLGVDERTRRARRRRGRVPIDDCGI